MIEERRHLPESIGGLLDAAFRAYRGRFRLYFGTAFLGFVLQAIVAYFSRDDIGVVYGGSIVVDAFVCALVAIGVVADMKPQDGVTDAAIANVALQRWGVVALVTTLVAIVTFFTGDAVFGPPQDTAYGFLTLAIVVAWGSLAFASVIAAIDEKTPPLVLALASIGRSISLALARQNLGRLAVLALVAVLPTLLENVLTSQLAVRKIPGWHFIGDIPIDALVTGPLQALFTVFYLDFVRRAAGPQGR